MVTTKSLSLWDNYNQLTPFAVGFDRMFNNLNMINENTVSTGFPPYNIQKVGEFTYTIEMALAGFSKEDISVELKENILSIRSDKKEEPDDEHTVHRGISYRKFDRKFTLADDIVVNDAKLENGLLIVDLEQIVPEEKKPRLIEVN
jgi:molecular chaperone IbpA